MKLLLINPPYKEVYTKVPTVAGKNQPLNLACLAAYLREKGIKVSILDAEALEISLENLHKYIKKDFDVVGVGAVTPTLKNAAKVLEICKRINPDCKTLVGGSHITAIPIETMKLYPVIDYAIMGEGEITTLELLKALKKNKSVSKIKGLAYRKGKKIITNKPRPLMESIENLPLPAFDLLPMHLYSPPAHHTSLGENILLKPFVIYHTGRGCPYQCTYCAAKLMWHRRVRHKSIKKVMEEIDILVNRFKIKNLEINDETFTVNKKRTLQFNSELKKRKYDLAYNCITRVDTVDKELLTSMKKAGCYFVRYGVESGNQKILDAMKKGITIKQIKDAFKITNKIKLTNSASFIIGYPGETRETINDTIKLSKQIKPTLAYFFVCIPIVGTDLYNEAKKRNLILHKDWTKYVQMPDKAMLKTETLSSEELIKLRNKAYKQFYLRPQYILSRLFKIRTIEQLKFYTKGALGVFTIIKK